MAPSYSRQLLVWSLPTIAILVSYFWYRKKKLGRQLDPSCTENLENNCKKILNDKTKQINKQEHINNKTLQEEFDEIDKRNIETNKSNQLIEQNQDNNKEKSPNRKISRSLSGVDTAPIDIKIPLNFKTAKSNPVIITDEDLDIEIEKIKSMKYGGGSSMNKLKFNNSITPIKSVKATDEKHILNNNNNNNNYSNNHNNNNNNNKSPFKVSVISTSSAASSDSVTKSEIKNTEMVEKNITFVEEKLSSFNLTSLTNETPTKLIKNYKIKDLNKLTTKSSIIKSIPPTPTPSPSTSSVASTPIITSVTTQMTSSSSPSVVTERTSTSIANENNIQRQANEKIERDSANHSPADVMLASPSLSSISDNHSEGSNDSGKGGSEMATPSPSRTPCVENALINDVAAVPMPTVYEFVIPQQLVGKLIGKLGCFVTHIKEITNAHIVVKNHPTYNKLKLCAIEGYQNEIDNALKLIREKFPLNRFPDITLEQVECVTDVITSSSISLVPDHLYLKLVEGINNDTIVSCMVSPNHLFLQQPTHPSFLNLNTLNDFMNMCYNQSDSPLLPTPIPENTICAAYSIGSWCRAIILSTDTETNISYVKFLDYGGYAFLENTKLRQIRGDFMLLPFQAAECFLANIKPFGNVETWPAEAYNFVANVTKGAIIYTQIVNYSEDGVPLVHCYIVCPEQLVFLNQELVNQGFAEWITFELSEDEQFQQQPEQQLDNNLDMEGAVGIAV